MTITETIDIQVGNLEAELTKLGHGQEQKNQVRACLFNLIIFSKDQRKAAYLHRMVKNILEKFPCRIIFIQEYMDSSNEFLRALASTVSINQGETSIVCDQINIDATTRQLNRVPFVILPLLVPDLPLYLVWGQKPTSDTIILPHLQRYASRLIFDPDNTDDLQEFSQKILHLQDTTQLEIRDVRWAALGGWREVLAQTFDSQQKSEQLRRCKELIINFNSHESIFITHTELQALYLQAWIAAQMGWDFKKMHRETTRHTFTYEYQGNVTSVSLIPQDVPSLPAGTIIGFEAKSNEDYSFVLLRKDKNPIVTAHITLDEKCEMPNSLVLNDLINTPSVMKEIFYRKTSPHYHHMLRMIAKTEGL